MTRNVVPKEILLKREVLIYQLEQLDVQRQKILTDMAILEKAALLFDPEYRPQTVGKRAAATVRQASQSVPGKDLVAQAAKLLRDAKEPLTAATISAAIADRHGVADDDRKARAKLEQRVRTTLNSLERAKVIEGVRVDGDRRVLWRMPLQEVG